MRSELHDLPQGWLNHIEKILELLDAHQPLVCVELGTWLGASAIAIARVIRRWGGILTCVDTWTGNVYGESSDPPTMLATCAANIVAAGVHPSIRFLVARTDEAAAYWREPLDFLYIDANHSYDSVCGDLAAWWPHLKVGGLIAGDDYLNEVYPGVTQAWDDFGKEHPLQYFKTAGLDRPNLTLVYGVRQQ